ncbi:MAG: universal stress protein [Nitrospirota bacterium]|nr:MAG: universal stress protein [Nitrospirota bacterium]
MRVLLGVDGSKGSQEAAKAIVHLSPPEEVILLNVVKVPNLAYQSAWLRIKDLSIIVEEEMRKEGEAVLEGIAAELSSYAKSITPQIENGDPGEVILNVAGAAKVTLIVLGARGLNRLSEMVFGSVSHRVMSHAICPTLIVKSPIQRMSSVLVPIEGAEDAHRAMDFLAKKPFREFPHITVLHAVPFAQPHWLEGALIPEGYRNELMVAGEALNSQIVAGLASLGYEAVSLLLDGPPVELIVKAVRERQPDLMIVGSHGRKGLSRFVLGSVAHAVVHRASCSMMVLR